MVYFVCNKCQETLRKNKVEGHSYSCHSDSFSCVDCNAHFDSKTFKEHNTCISEEEKYQGKLYNPKKEKENPQLEWMRLLDSAKDSCTDSSVKSALDQLCNLDNVPRKKKQFYNYVNNCVHIPTNTVDKVWEILESLRQKQIAEKKAIEDKVKAEIAARKKAKLEKMKEEESSSSSSWDTSSSDDDDKKEEKKKITEIPKKSIKETKEKKSEHKTSEKKSSFDFKKYILKNSKKSIKLNELKQIILEKAMKKDNSLTTESATSLFYHNLEEIDFTLSQ
ncbi:hypothetical protein WA158_001346 [Blastocystis sp. Blastoise]